MSRSRTNQPQGIARFQAATPRASTPGVQPIKFTAGSAYIEQMSAVADLGEGIFNATQKVVAASERAKQAEKDAYLANVETDDIVQTNRIYNENMLEGNDPQKLAVRLGEYKNGKMASMPEEVQPYYAQSFDKRAAVLTTRSQDSFFRDARKKAGESLSADQQIIKEDIFNNPSPTTEVEAQHYEEKIGKFRSVLESRVNQGFITPEQAVLEQRDFQKELITAGYKAQMQTMDADQRAQAILKLQESKSLPKGITVEDKEEIVAKLNAYDSTVKAIEVKANAAQKAEQELETARVAADLEIGVSRSEKSYEDVVKAEQEGIISPAKKVQLFKMLDNNTNKAVQDGQSLEKISQVWQGKAFIDPKQGSDDLKAVNLFYDEVLSKKLETVDDPAAKKQTLANFVDKMGVVPEQLRGEMRGAFRSDNVEAKVYYADLVGRIQEVKPQALDDFDTKDITQAVMIDEMIKAGETNEKAVEKVQKLTEGINGGRLEVLKADLEQRRKDIGSKQDQNDRTLNTIVDAFQLDKDGERTFWATNAKLPSQKQMGVEAAAIADYNNLYETWFYNTNGDAKIAEKQAKLAFRRTWGVTDVNGQRKQLTKYPIENFYKMPSEAIKTQLLEDIKAIPELKDKKADEVFIQWDNQTAREAATGSPKYTVTYLDENGLLMTYSERWNPDVQAYNKKLNERLKRRSKEQDLRSEKLKDLPEVDKALEFSTFTPYTR